MRRVARLSLARIAWVGGVILMTALLVLAARQLDLQRVLTETRQARLGWLFLASACYVVTLPLWAEQWRILAPPSPRNTFDGMLAVASINSTVYCTAVALVGEASGVALLVSRIGLDRAAALSVIAMDQLLVGVAKLSIIAVAAIASPLPAWMRTGLVSLGVAVLLLAAVVLIFAWTHESVSQRTSRMLPPMVHSALGRLGHSLAPLRSPRRGMAATLLALAKITMQVLAVVCVQHAFHASVPATSAFLVVAALSLTTMLPLVPGNLGVFEATIVLVYTRLGLTPEQALGMGLLQHACFITSLALPGYFWLLGWGPRLPQSESSGPTG